MKKIMNIFLTLLAAAWLLPDRAGAQLGAGTTVEPLANGTTAFLTDTGAWQLDDWSKEANIARDAAGNTYLVGTFQDGGYYRPFLRKLSPAGTEIWTSTVANFENPANYYDYGRGVSVSPQGYVFSLSVMTRASQDMLLARHDPATGEVIWRAYFDSGDWSDNAYDLVADSTYAYVAGTSQNDITLVRFAVTNGTSTFVRYDGGDNYNVAYAIAQNDNDLAVAGMVYDGRDYNNPADIEYGNEIWTAKFTKNLAHVWASTYTAANHPEYGNDEAHAVKMDMNGNVYAAGFHYTYESNSDIWLGKYDAAGNLVFAKTKNGPSSGYDKGFGLALDPFGNIYVTGRMEAYNLNQGDNLWLGKYAPSGALLSEVMTHRNHEAGYDVEASSSLVLIGGAFDDKAGVLAVGQHLFGAPQQLFAAPGWNTGEVNLSWMFEEAGDFDYRIQVATSAVWAWNPNAPANIGGNQVVTAGYTMQQQVKGLPVRIVHQDGVQPEPGPAYYFKVWTSPAGANTWTPLTNTASAVPNAPYNYWNYMSRGQDGFWVFNSAFSPASAITRDASGNTFIAYGNNMGGVALVKFDAEARPQWTSFYNLEAFTGRFIVNRIKLDAGGNIYAVGMVRDQMYPDGPTDAWIAKFNPLGIKVWDHVQAGFAGESDSFSAIAFDSAGKVYAGGEAAVGAADDDAMLLVKYEPASMAPAQQWISSYTYKGSTPAGQPASIWGLAVDASDNIYAGGYFSSLNVSKPDRDAAIVKFNASLAVISGTSYANPQAADKDGWDAISDLLVSGADIYAAGQKNMDVDFSTTSFWVAKINTSDLGIAWQEVYNSADSLDAAAYGLRLSGGALYAAGYENRLYPPDNQKNMVLRKYDLAGTPQWTRAVDGTYQNENALSYGLEVGADGYYYLAGVFNMNSYSEGNPGVARISEPQSGMAAEPGYRPCSVRLSWVTDTELPQGTTVYVHYATYTGVAFNDTLAQYSFYTDYPLFNGEYLQRLVPGLEAGNGAPVPGQPNWDSPLHYFKIGYKKPGDATVTAVAASTAAVPNTIGIWDRMDRFPNGTLFVMNEAHGGRNPLARDAEGNIYTAGTISPWGWGSATAFVRKYNAQGVPVWTRYYADEYQGSNPVINALAFDAAGNLYAAGTAGSDTYQTYPPYGPESPTKRDALLIKYDATGRMVWAKTYDLEDSNGNDEINGVAVGPSAVYLSGKFWNSLNTTEDATVLEVDLNGVRGASYVSSLNGDDVFNGLAFDTVNNRIYAVGRYHNGADHDGFLKTLNVSMGDTGLDINVDEGYEDELYAVLVDTVNSSLYLAGAVSGDSAAQDAYVAKHNMAGVQQWAKTYNSANENNDEAYGLALDGVGGVYVSGAEYRYDVSQGKNLFVRKHSAANGDLIWMQALNSGASNEDNAGGVAADSVGNVYAAVDAGMMGAVTYSPSGITNLPNGTGFFKHTQFNMNVTNPVLTVRVKDSVGAALTGVPVAVLGFSPTGGVDPNAINLGFTAGAGGEVSLTLPAGKTYFVAISSHNMMPSIKDQLSDPGGNFFVDLYEDTVREYSIHQRPAGSDPVYRMTLNVSTHTGNLNENDYVMAEVFLTQTGERIGYSVLRAPAGPVSTMEVGNLPAAADGVYGMAVSVPARNKVLQVFMTGPFPSTSVYNALMADASQLSGSFEVGTSTVPPSVAGMVSDLNWSPLSGVKVRLERYNCTGISGPDCTGWERAYEKETLTDAGGSFSFYAVPQYSCADPMACTIAENFSKQYNLMVSKAGYERGHRNFILPEPAAGMPPVPWMEQFNLLPATYTLTGMLKYNGVPLPNANIMVEPDWDSYSEGDDSYRQGDWGGSVGIRSDGRAVTGADGSFTVTGLTDGNARINASFEGGWRQLNQGSDPSNWADNLRVVISSQTSRGPQLPANNACRAGRVWVINSSGTCVSAGSVAFNIVPEGENNAGTLSGSVTFVTTYPISGLSPLTISTAAPLTLMAQESCNGGCEDRSPRMSFVSLAGTFLSDTTGYTMVISTGVTYYTRVFSTAWAKATSFDSEVSVSTDNPSVTQNISVVRAGALRGSVLLPDGSAFKPTCSSQSNCLDVDIDIRGVNVDSKDSRNLEESGDFELPNIAPGTYEVSLKSYSDAFVWAPVSQVVTVAEGRTTEVKLRLEAGLAVRPQIFGLPEVSTPSWSYVIVGVPSGTEMNQKAITDMFFSDPDYSFDYSTSTGWRTRYMPAGQYDFYLLLASRYDPGGGDSGVQSFRQFGNFIGRVRGVNVQKTDNPAVGTAAQPIAVNILGSVGQASVAGTVQGSKMFSLSDLERVFSNFNEFFPMIPAVMLYDSAGDLKGFANAMPLEDEFQDFEDAIQARDGQGMLDYLADHPMSYGIWGIPPGRYTAVFSNPNYPPVALDVEDITSPGTAVTAFDFDDQQVVTGGISGVVKSSTTLAPLAGARVYLKHRTVEKFALTDSSGAFTFSNIPAGIYRLEVSRNGYVTVGRKTSLAGNDSVSFGGTATLYMLPSESKLSGRLFMSKFPTQVTKAGVEIVVYDETDNVNFPEAYLPKAEVQTDASGNYEITGVVPGHLYKLSAFYAGKMPEVLEVTAQEGNTVVRDITLRDIPPQLTIKVKKAEDSLNKVDVVIKSPKQLMAAPSCTYNPGESYAEASAVTLALVPGPNKTYLGQFTVSSSQRYYTVRVVAGDAGNKMVKEFTYDKDSNAKTEQYIQQESLAGGAVQMDKESEEYSGIELDPGALSYSTATSATVDYSNLVGGFFSALPSVRTVKTAKGNLTITAAIQDLMASEVYNMDLSNASANKPFTLTLKYDKERGAGSRSLRIYQQDGSGNWKEVPGNYTVDPMLGVLSVDVASLTSAYEGTGAAATPLGRKRFGMSSVENGRYRPAATGTSQTGRFAVFTAIPPTGTAAYSAAFDVANLPNPFNLKSKSVTLSADIGAAGIANPYSTSGTVIKYNLPAGKSGNMKFVIYNLAGEKVRTISEGVRTGGQIYYSEWDGKNDNNQDCASGVYFMLSFLDGKKLGSKAHKMAIVK